jgi:predicted transcriptional regulator
MRREEIVRIVEGLLSAGWLRQEQENGYTRLKLTPAGIKFVRDTDIQT